MAQFSSRKTQAQRDFGLRADRPFRFCTMKWGHRGYQTVPPGDEPSASDMQCIEILLPEDEQTTTIYPHDHEFYEIALIRAGEAVHETVVGPYAIGRGDILVVTPPAVHAFHGIRGLHKTNIFLQPAWLFEDLRVLWSEPGLVRFLLADALYSVGGKTRLLRLHTTEAETALWERELEGIEAEARKPQPSLAQFNGCFLKILAVINNAYLRELAGQHSSLHPRIWSASERIEHWVRNGVPLDIEALAKSAGMPAPRFCAAFRAATGQPPRDYYRRRRVENAKMLLMSPDLSVTDVACRLGFSDGPHFSRVFKAEVGMSPREFREKGLPVIGPLPPPLFREGLP